MNKTDLYHERTQDNRHHVRMYIDPEYFKAYQGKIAPRDQEISVCREFNVLAKQYTKSDKFSVMLNLGLVHIAADLHFQYRQLLRWAEDKGTLQELRNDLFSYGITDLYKHIQQGVNQGAVAFETKKLLRVLPLINKGSAVAVLLYMKARCSKPTSPGGVTDLMDTTIAKGLGIKSRKTVYTARKLLEQHGVIEEVYKNSVYEDGKHVTYSKYQINI